MNLEPLRDALLPCPFCASEQIAIAPCREFGDLTWSVVCKACGAHVTRDLEADAIAAWNTRAPDPEIQRMRSVIEAWHDIDRKRDAEVERLKTALEPFVSGYSHTSVFLSSRQKMHPAGQDLYRDDVERAIAALKEPSHED